MSIGFSPDADFAELRDRAQDFVNQVVISAEA
jgi:hypothetical protein